MAAGSIVIDLLMRTGSFETDTKRAEKRLKELEQAASNVGKVLGAAVAAGATAAVYAFNSLAKAAGEYQDIAEKIGDSGEAIASLAVAAGTSGTKLETVSAASIKLTSALSKLDDEGKGAGAALKALNIPLDEFKQLSPVDQLEQVAKGLAQFEDGAGKTAVAVALFGKNGAELLPFLKELGTGIGRVNILTEQQIQLADEYSDRQARSSATLKIYAEQFAANLIPAVIAFQNALSETIKPLIEVDNKAGNLGNNNGVTRFALAAVEAFANLLEGTREVVSYFEKVGVSVSRALESISLAKSGKFKEILDLSAQTKKDIADIESGKDSSLQGFVNNLRAQVDKVRNSTAAPKDSRPKLNFSDTAGKDDGSIKKLLDGQLKELRRFAEQQKDAFDFINASAQASYDAGLLSLSQFFEQQNAIRSAALQSQLGSIDQEINALRAARLKLYKPEDRIDIDNKIADAQDRRIKLSQQAGFAAALAAQKEAQALIELKNRYDDLTASVLELQGNTSAAAAIRNAQQVTAARKLITQAGGDQGQADKLKELLDLRTKLNEISEKSGIIFQNQATQEGFLRLASQTGTQGQIETLIKLGQISRNTASDFEPLVVNFERFARASGNPKLIADAEALRLKLEELKATADPLKDTFNKLFEDGFSDAFASFIDGTKSASQAFKDFSNTIFREINKIVAKDIAKALFGGGGSASGLGGIFAGLFGGGAATSSAGLGLDSIFGGFFAEGGTPPMGKVSVVGENGPELFIPNTAGRIIPNDMLSKQASNNPTYNSINVNVTATPGMSRDTALQQGMAYGNGINRALFRNGN